MVGSKSASEQKPLQLDQDHVLSERPCSTSLEYRKHEHQRIVRNYTACSAQKILEYRSCQITIIKNMLFIVAGHEVGNREK